MTKRGNLMVSMSRNVTPAWLPYRGADPEEIRAALTLMLGIVLDTLDALPPRKGGDTMAASKKKAKAKKAPKKGCK